MPDAAPSPAPDRPAALPPLRLRSEPGPPLRTGFGARLDAVDDELTGAALLVAEALPGAVRAVLAADTSGIGPLTALAREVRSRCRAVEDEGFRLLALEAPVSRDLRRLVALLQLVQHVERAASILRHLAEVTADLDPRALTPEVRMQLQELALRSIAVFTAGLDAWRRRDALAVHELGRADREVDRMRTGLLVGARRLAAEPEALVSLGLVARYLERLADHGVVIAHHATFALTGERVEVGG